MWVLAYNLGKLSFCKIIPIIFSKNSKFGKISIPETLFVRVFRLKLNGLGYQGIANELNRLGVATSRGR